jgi:hypothetical protein
MSQVYIDLGNFLSGKDNFILIEFGFSLEKFTAFEMIENHQVFSKVLLSSLSRLIYALFESLINSNLYILFIFQYILLVVR